MNTIFLKIAALIYFCIAALHVYIIFAGAPAYRFFGAGEQFARESEQGSFIPAIVTSFIFLVFVLWGLYALSAARVIKPLLLTRVALIVIATILLLRGGLPFMAAALMPLDTFMTVTSLIVLGIGIIHALGTYQVWHHLEPAKLHIRNVHQRQLENNPENGRLLNQLASSNDILWAHERWMPMIFDRPLQVGAHGGHASIRYDIEKYTPSQHIRFRFTAPKGFDGWHELTLQNNIMRHEINMTARGKAIAMWFLIRPIHDALVEDCLDKAEAFAATRAVKPRTWSLWVRFLRTIKKITPQESEITNTKAEQPSARG